MLKIKHWIVSAAIFTSLVTTTAFAVPAAPNEKPQDNSKKPGYTEYDNKEKCEEFEKDPVKFLENKKQEINKLLEQGKISRDKAEKKLKRIDKMIREIKEFEKLSLREKKEKLIKDCEIYLTKKMESGKITQKEAEEIFKDYVDKINKWDGSGFPMFHKKGFKHD